MLFSRLTAKIFDEIVFSSLRDILDQMERHFELSFEVFQDIIKTEGYFFYQISNISIQHIDSNINIKILPAL